MAHFVSAALAIAALAGWQFTPMTSADRWDWPLETHVIERTFVPPEHRYGTGHRGIDIPGFEGEHVRAVAAGTVSFVGRVAGINTITIDHGVERSTYQPVTPNVRFGDSVSGSQIIGVLGTAHPSCLSTCLNLGRIKDQAYLDPAEKLSSTFGFALISPDGPVPQPPRAELDLADYLAAPVSSAFGMRVHPVTGVRKLHDGVDFAAACGTPVPSIDAGTVTFSGWRGAYGEHIEIRHSENESSSYSHLSTREAFVGQTVEANQRIGLVGTTGLSTGCHLHLMTLRDGVPVNPMD